MHIRLNDTVEVIAGDDRGQRGKVLAVDVAAGKVVVEGVNRVKRHTKVGQTARGAQTGGIITQEASIHISNVMLIDPEDGRATRVGSRKDDNGKNVRISRRTGKDI